MKTHSKIVEAKSHKMQKIMLNNIIINLFIIILHTYSIRNYRFTACAKYPRSNPFVNCVKKE